MASVCDDVLVRVTELSGKELQVTLNCDETIFALCQKVSDAMGVHRCNLKLLHCGDILKEGMLKDLVDGDSVDVTAVHMANPEAFRRSQRLVRAFKNPSGSQGTWIDDVWTYCSRNLKLIEAETPAIRKGEVDFNFQGDNFLELVISNFPKFNIDKYVNLLLTSGASLNSPSRDGYTPLLAACARGFGQIAETLLKYGANPDATYKKADALLSALKFFEACVNASSHKRTEDLQLAKFCCQLRDLKIKRVLPTLSPLGQARLKLSQLAPKMAVLASPGFELSKAKVLERSGLSEKDAEDFGADLWAGWPLAFLSFELDLKEGRDCDKYFVYARARVLRVLVYHVPESLKKPTRNEYHLDDTSSEACSDSSYHCDCPVCCPWMYESLASYYETYKEQNRKWHTAKSNHRRSRRVPVPLGSKRVLLLALGQEDAGRLSGLSCGPSSRPKGRQLAKQIPSLEAGDGFRPLLSHHESPLLSTSGTSADAEVGECPTDLISRRFVRAG
eukprot:Skav204404  [mRNA]  locus=scaffold4169:156635:158143:+ [translate_table: standard]